MNDKKVEPEFIPPKEELAKEWEEDRLDIYLLAAANNFDLITRRNFLNDIIAEAVRQQQLG